MEKIKLGGLLSTCAVMDWIEQNGCPKLYCQQFEFPDDLIQGGFFKGLPRNIVVSEKKPDWATLELYPVEEWHQVTPTQKRLNCDGLGWYAKIGEKFYWMTK